MVIPIAVDKLDEADVAFGETAGEEAIIREARLARFGAILLEHFLGFFGNVHEIGNAGLHAISHFVGFDARGNLRIADGAELDFVELLDGVEEFAGC